MLHWLLQERLASRQAAGQTQAPAGNSSSTSLLSWLFTVLPAKTVDHHEHPETQADHSTRAWAFSRVQMCCGGEQGENLLAIFCGSPQRSCEPEIGVFCAPMHREHPTQLRNRQIVLPSKIEQSPKIVIVAPEVFRELGSGHKCLFSLQASVLTSTIPAEINRH